MHRWRPAQKRSMLLAMLVPWGLVVLGSPVAGSVFASGGGSDTLLTVLAVCFVGGFAIAFVTAMCCVADAVTDRRVAPSARAGWAISLLLAPTVAGPVYWWLHVRMGEDEPHGLPTLTPARAWPARLKTATGIAALVTLLFFAAWGAWIVSFFFDFDSLAIAVPMFAAFGVWTPVACAVITLFVLDALREGGAHAMPWTTLLLLAWVVAAPLYWLLYVRPTGRADAGP